MIDPKKKQSHIAKGDAHDLIKIMSTSHTNKIYFDDMIEVKNEKFYKTFDSFLKFYKQFRQNEILDLNQREKKI